MKITVETAVADPIAEVWPAYTQRDGWQAIPGNFARHVEGRR